MIGFRPLARKALNLSLALSLAAAQLFAPISAFIPKAAAAPVCVVDTAGANDEPGQKDLTKLCVDYAGVPTTVATTWNWDDLGTSGANTMDACNLFDTDGDGNINYSVCVTTQNTPATLQTLTTYSCGDDKIDRCTSPATVVPNGATSCSVSQQATDPFAAGNGYPIDTQGSCTIQLSTVGGATAKLVDVCSYPSAQPNSDPSDCVIAREDFGKVELIKDLIPGTDPGLFNLTINGPEASDTTTVNNVGDGGTTGEVVVKKGSVVVSETAGTGTALSGYTTTLVCRDLNGTGAVLTLSNADLANGTTRQATFTLAEDTDVVCVITNTASSSITIIKDAVPNDSQDFSFTATGSGVSNFALDDDSNGTLLNSKTFSNLTAGTYNFTEAATAGWYLDGIDCPNITETKDLSTGNVSLTITAGQNVTCTFTNRKLGQIIVTKQTDPNNDPTQFSITASPSSGIVSPAATQPISDNQTVTYTVRHGTYSVVEDPVSGWAKDDSQCQGLVIDGNTPLVGGIPTRSCTITNTKLATLNIVKDALPDHAQDFGFTTTNLGGASFSLDDDANGTLPNQQTFNNLTPGQTYSVTEQSTSGWSLTGLSCNGVAQVGSTASVTPSAGEIITCTFTNTKLISVSGTKFEVDAGATNGGLGTVLSGWTIYIDSNNNGLLDPGESFDITDSNGDYSFENLLYGTTVVLREVLQAGWTQIFGPSSFTLDSANDVTDKDFGNFQNGSISGFKWNDKNANDVADDGEEKLNGWTITLYNDGPDVDTDLDDVVTSTATAGSGGYSFTNLAPDTYAVCETQQAGWIQTYPNGNACHIIVIDESGETNEANFGNQGRGTITVIKDVDTDNDGDVDLSGVTDWTWDIAGGAQNTATGSSQNVAAGTYTINEDQKTDYHVTDLTCDDQSYGAVESGDVTVGPGDSITCTFTNARDTGTITVRKIINPTDDNGLFDLNINDVTYGNDVSHGEGTGTIQFPTGTYNVSEAAGTGTSLSDYSSSFECDNDLSGNGTATGNFTLGTDEDVVCVFTNVRYGHIIVEKQTLPDGDDVTEFEFTTDYSDNFFLMDDEQDNSGNLLPGTYSVEELGEDGWDLTSATCDDQSDPNSISLQAGETVKCTFTNTQRGSISGTKYEVDADATDGGEGAPLIGWTIFIDENDNGELDIEELSDNTDVLGEYSFENLVPGEYTICEVLQDGWTQIFPKGCHEVTVDPGEDDSANDFGNFQNGSISGYKWNDLNGNSEEDEGEVKLPGWTITLYRDEQEVDSTDTDEDGNYSFENLTPGEYMICETNQFGWVQTFPEGCHSIEINVSGEEGTAVFGNQGRGTITVLKNVDMNADGDTEDEEDIIGATDWTWDLNGDLASDSDIATGEIRDIPAGSYTVNEDQKVPDYAFVSVECINSREQTVEVDQAESFGLTVNPGDNIVCTFTNLKKPVVLLLTKSNNRPDPTVVGDTVTYTLTVTVPSTSGTSYDTVVTDLPPEGFNFVSGSETASLGSLTTAYGSPGQWTLGDLTPGTTVTLTYQTLIASSASAGTYPDVAFAEGCAFPEVEGDCELTVLGNVSAGSDTPFVATRVTIKAPQVLGASTTVLVNTGAADIWRNLMVGTMLLGVGLATLVRRQKKGAQL